MSFDDLGIVGAVAFILVVVVALAVYIPIDVSTQRRCLSAGYPHGTVTYALERYCVRRDKAEHGNQSAPQAPNALPSRGTP